jgi:hypothetical protein
METKCINNFWKAYNSSRCKTAMLVISIIVTLAFSIDQIWGSGNQDLAKAFFAVMAYWIGRTSKSKES